MFCLDNPTPTPMILTYTMTILLDPVDMVLANCCNMLWMIYTVKVSKYYMDACDKLHTDCNVQYYCFYSLGWSKLTFWSRIEPLFFSSMSIGHTRPHTKFQCSGLNILKMQPLFCKWILTTQEVIKNDLKCDLLTSAP